MNMHHCIDPKRECHIHTFTREVLATDVFLLTLVHINPFIHN
jgi:hypothetical protein